MTHTHTHVYVHAWASTDVLARDEHPGMVGMPRAGDECAVDGCDERLRAGERAVAVIEYPGRVDGRERWCGETHDLHRTWRDGDPHE